MLSGNELSIQQIAGVVFDNGVSADEILLRLQLVLNEKVVALTKELELLNQGSETEDGYNQALFRAGRFENYAQNIAAANARKLQLGNEIANCYYMVGHIHKKTGYPLFAQISMQVALSYFQKDNVGIIFVYRSLAEICLQEKNGDAEKFLVEGRSVAHALATKHYSEDIRSYIEWTDKELEKLDKNKYRRVEPARVIGNVTSKNEDEIKQDSAENTVPALAGLDVVAKPVANSELTQNTLTAKSRLSYFWALAPVAAAGAGIVVNAVLKSRKLI